MLATRSGFLSLDLSRSILQVLSCLNPPATCASCMLPPVNVPALLQKDNKLTISVLSDKPILYLRAGGPEVRKWRLTVKTEVCMSKINNDSLAFSLFASLSSSL